MAQRPLLHQQLRIVGPRLCNPHRPFNSSVFLRLKEDGDRSPEQLEQKKQQQVHKAKQGEARWHEGLASSGESNVKADREQPQDHDQHIQDLQKETAKKGQKGEI